MIWWELAQNVLQEHNWIQIKRRGTKYQKGGIWLDNLFELDTESTSAFRDPDGNILPFDFTHSESFWSKCDKYGWTYIWIFGVDDLVFYGRTLPELKSFLELLDDITGQAQKITFVHNLSWDFQFIRNVIPFERIFCRKKRKVLTADWDNYHFRCSYFLVNMSLAKWAETKHLPVTKAVGELYYNRIRTPLTELTDEEKDYCERDILVMYEGLKLYREKYGHVYKIPLTQTGEIRVELSKAMENEKSWKSLMGKLIPRTLEEYLRLMSAFFGGDTHASYYLADKLLHGVRSVDFASSYPWVMLSRMFPLGYFARVTKNRERFMRNKNYCYLITFDAFGLKSKLHNTFLSSSRCKMVLNGKADNGRLLSADFIQATFTNVDFEMLQDFYEIDRIEILDFYVSHAGYLNPTLCLKLIDMYEKKTSLKNVPDMEDVYLWNKQCINGVYGDTVTRDFSGDITWNPETGEWGQEDLSETKYQEKAGNKRKNFPKLYKAAQIGVWVTAYARENLWRHLIVPLDHQVAYFDTDSIKYIGNDIQGAIPAYNMLVMRQHAEVAKRLGIDASRLSPAAPDGSCYPIGLATDEGVYKDFKTLGAKKYAKLQYNKKKKRDELEITIAGVPKGCSEMLSCVDDLTNDFYFPPSDKPGQQKSLVHYQDEQNALIVDGWLMDSRYGICLQPTGYKAGMTLEYMALLAMNAQRHQHDLDFIVEAIEEATE